MGARLGRQVLAHSVGSLKHATLVCRCVVDMKPRTLSAEEFNVLSNFAELAVRQLEKDHLLQLQRLVRLPACSCQLPGKMCCMQDSADSC